MAIQVSRETVAKIKELLLSSELTYEDFTGLSNSELEKKLKVGRAIRRIKKAQPDAQKLCEELLKHKKLTKALLWEEYRLETNGNGVGYTRFCELIKAEQKQQEISMKQEYFPGEAIQIDYSGNIEEINLHDGGVIEANIFIGSLPYTSLFFINATYTQKTEDWIQSCLKMFNKINGMPKKIICDNAKPLITKHNNRIVNINPYFQEFLEFHKISVYAARKRKPKDKAVVESTVNIVQQQILLRMRNEKFSGLDDFNTRLEYLTDLYNHKKTKTFPNGRMTNFLEKEKDLLRPLPLIKFKVLNQYSQTVVPTNYHIQYLDNSYSVPYQYIRDKVELKIIDNNLYIFKEKKLIAQHIILQGSGKISTLEEHQTQKHRMTGFLSEKSILSWSKSIGVNTFNYCNMILYKDVNLKNNLNYLYELRSWVNSNQFNARLEQALLSAYKMKLENLDRLKSIIKSESYLKNNTKVLNTHKNLRGANYYKGDK